MGHLMFDKPQDGTNCTRWRLDLLGIELVNKEQGVKLPNQVQWKPFIQNYQSILTNFVELFDGYYQDVYDDACSP